MHLISRGNAPFSSSIQLKRFQSAVFLLLVNVSAVLGIWYYFTADLLNRADFIVFGITASLSGLCFSAGYHRYFSHKSYECHPAIQILYLVFGASVFDFSALDYASRHRKHHAYTDQDNDPQFADGFFKRHFIWVFFRKNAWNTDGYKNVSDLKKNALVMWQHQYYWWIAVSAGIVLPVFLGFLFSTPLGGLIWSGVARICLIQHIIFANNSVAHTFGSQKHSTANSSRDNSLLAVIALGDGYHNYHHTFPNDYRHGPKWYQFDSSKQWIRSLAALGLAWNLKGKK